jgi:CRISPR system Cascade subunit CasE
MYLSRLALNPRSRQVRREVAEPYEMHRTLLRAFPDGMDKEAERVLFRLDADRETGALVVLVQSQGGPDWSSLEAKAGYLLRPAESKEFDPSFRQGQRLFFRLRANPTVRRDGKRLGLRTEAEQVKWLKRKGLAGGFHLEDGDVLAIPEGLKHGRKTDDLGPQSLTHLAVHFDGILKVTDPAQLVETLRAGVGRGKAFGFGLLSLAGGR